MYGAAADTAAAGDSERTAFRRAEKKYKLYRPQGPKSRKKGVENKTDVSDVVDFRGVCELFEMGGELPENVDGFRWPGMRSPVFRFRDRPGFYFIPNALTIEEQCYWIRESLTTFPQPPNRTNHTAIYGPISDLFSAVQSQKVLIKSGISTTDEKSGSSSGESNLHSCNYKFSEVNGRVSERESHKPIAASVLLRKLRWSTLGLQFDWSKRNYDVSLPHMKIPDTLSQLAKKLAAPAMPLEEEFLPEAAIVNYFGSSDMLGGHLDDMEVDWSKPIVSISLGCQAVFLLGGKSREDLPIAMFLHSGDVVLMASQARQCFHGVPRIFTDGEHAGVSELVPQFTRKEDICFMDYIKSSRININIRQVN